ncbi:hypothetical protein Tco_1546107 [Tanacetum coccineum]
MVALKFASSHNMVAFLNKPTESDGFKQIVDVFERNKSYHILLTLMPTTIIALLRQFWATAKSRRKQRKDIEVSQPSDPTEPMADETKNVENEGLGAQEDASKQGREIVDLDADAEVTLVDEAQERNDDYLMFDIGVLDE